MSRLRVYMSVMLIDGPPNKVNLTGRCDVFVRDKVVQCLRSILFHPRQIVQFIRNSQYLLFSFALALEGRCVDVHLAHFYSFIMWIEKEFM